MKKCIFNVVFYFLFFCIVSRSIFCLAFTVPPVPGTPGYEGYLWASVMISIVIGLMVVVPNLIVEYLIHTWNPQA